MTDVQAPPVHKRVSLVWCTEATPVTVLNVNGKTLDLNGASRVAVVIDEAYEEPVVDVSYGMPLPIVLGDVSESSGNPLSPADWLDGVNPDQLKQAVLQVPQGLEGLDPVSATLKMLQSWARSE